MCEYLRLNKCSISNDLCPFVYFCEKQHMWKENKNIPKDCKVKERVSIPEGFCKVKMERKGFLYVDLGDSTVKLVNPFENVPQYVKVRKYKNKWKIIEKY